MKIAVDFDGTIVAHRYPKIGHEIPFAFHTLKALQKQGHALILWTFRAGEELDEAVRYCEKNGLKFFAVNSSYPQENFDNSLSRKIDAEVFIDDRNIGGFIGWKKIWESLNEEQIDGYEDEFRILQREPEKTLTNKIKKFITA